MVRIATEQDAAQLQMLNNEFNGEGETTLENIRASLTANRQEVVIVDEDQGELTGFVCVQLKKSFCYDDYMPEITEVYVKPQHRRSGIAGAMIAYAEEYCQKHYLLHKFELLPERRTRRPGLLTQPSVTARTARYILQKDFPGNKTATVFGRWLCQVSLMMSD